MKEMAKRINEAVVNAKLTNDEAGDKVGVSGESVRLWRSGKVVPRIHHIQALAEVCRVSDNWLLVGITENSEFESRHISLIRDYLSLPEALRFGIRQTIETSARIIDPKYQNDFKKKQRKAKKKLAKKRRPA